MSPAQFAGVIHLLSAPPPSQTTVASSRLSSSDSTKSFLRNAARATERFLILRLTQTFYDREDHGLEARLQAELPAILNWALIGLDRLTCRGRFLQPTAAHELIEELELLASPVRAFMADECIKEAGAIVAAATLFDAYRDWCRLNGREHPGTLQNFGRDMRAAMPNLHSSRPRGPDGSRPGRHYNGIRLRRISDGD